MESKSHRHPALATSVALLLQTAILLISSPCRAEPRAQIAEAVCRIPGDAPASVVNEQGLDQISRALFVKFLDCSNLSANPAVQLECLRNGLSGFFSDGLGETIGALGTAARETGRAAVSGIPGGTFLLEALGVEATQSKVAAFLRDFGPQALEAARLLLRMKTDPLFALQTAAVLVSALGAWVPKVAQDLIDTSCVSLAQSVCKVMGKLGYEAAVALLLAALTLPEAGVGGGIQAVQALSRAATKYPQLGKFLAELVTELRLVAASNTPAARTVARLLTLPVTEKTIVLDSNMIIAIERFERGLELNSSEKVAVRMLQKWRYEGFSFRVPESVIPEVARQRPTGIAYFGSSIGKLGLTAERTSGEYLSILRQLENGEKLGQGGRWLRAVGGPPPDGVTDRQIIADLFFSRREGSVTPTIVSPDQDLVKALMERAGIDPARLGRQTPMAAFPNGFEVSLTDSLGIRRTIRVIPVPNR